MSILLLQPFNVSLHTMKMILILIGNGDEASVKLASNFFVHPQSNDLQDHLREFGGRVLIDMLTSMVR